MSLPEIVWRAEGKVRHVVDRLALSARSEMSPVSSLVNGQGRAGLIRPALFDGVLPEVSANGEFGLPEAWRQRTLAAADRVGEHRLTIFDLEDHDLGSEIDWNYEHKARKSTPMRFAPDIDYRDRSEAGDCKFVWEPNRHHQFVTSARAYRLTGDERYAATCLDQLVGWVERCPYGTGMNWRSPLELGIRLINWVWTLELIRPSRTFQTRQEDVDRITSAAYRHIWDVARNYSRYSSANNHLIGEAAGVYIGSSYFAGFKTASRWRARARRILIHEIFDQSYPDGGTREQAFGYQLFVMQFFLLAGLTARRDGDDFRPEFWQRLEKMFDFVAAFLEGGSPPLFGDCDDGYVLDLGGSLGEPKTLMAIGAVLYKRDDFKALAGEFTEPALWLLGVDGRRTFNELGGSDVGFVPQSRAFQDSGYYLLQSGPTDRNPGVSVTFDCGELGFRAIAAHGHADALSVTLRVGGKDVLVDSGTYDYFTYDHWRDYFRSTKAHNTVVVDDVDQSVALGSFMWGERAEAKCLRWEPSESGGTVEGEHDGYGRLTDPVTHRRSVTLGDDPLQVVVRDELIANAGHDIAMYWHLGEQCSVKSTGPHRYEIDFGSGTVTMEFDTALSVSAKIGSEDPILGWVSRAYHRKEPTTSLVATCRGKGNTTLCTRITIAPSRSR